MVLVGQASCLSFLDRQARCLSHQSFPKYVTELVKPTTQLSELLTHHFQCPFHGFQQEYDVFRTAVEAHEPYPPHLPRKLTQPGRNFYVVGLEEVRAHSLTVYPRRYQCCCETGQTKLLMYVAFYSQLFKSFPENFRIGPVPFPSIFKALLRDEAKGFPETRSSC